jgi:AI-2 transport system ATP-binding protein
VERSFCAERNITRKKPIAIIEKGLTYVPEDRHLNGIYAMSDVEANVTSGVSGIFPNFLSIEKNPIV